MTRYLAVSALGGEPFDLGTDDQGRAQFAFNVTAYKRESSTFVEELLAVLEGAGVGTRGMDIFGGSQAIIPDVATPVTHVRSTGGAAPVGTLTEGRGAYRRPSAQVLVRAGTSAAAEAVAQRAFSALLAVSNAEVVA